MKLSIARNLSNACILLLVTNISYLQASDPTRIDVDYPGGNIIVETTGSLSTLYYPVEDETIRIRPDLRDSGTDWFYWNFRITGAANRTLRFELPKDKLAAFGPAFSVDEGKNWKWLYDTPVSGRTHFAYTFAPDEYTVRFSSVIPYLEEDFSTFLSAYDGNPFLQIESLTVSPKGRNVEKIYIRAPNQTVSGKVVLTARHHACESMASYVLEGIMAAILDGKEDNMWWLRENIEFLIIPFMDKDGVEDGDQGKNRMPRDHNRDYIGQSLYRETAALRELCSAWEEGALKLALDLHCPYLLHEEHERIFMVGVKDEKSAAEQREFISILLEQNIGELKIPPEKAILEFGSHWNVDRDPDTSPALRSCREWFSTIPNIDLAATLEFSYAYVDGQMVTPEKARSLGGEIAETIAIYLQRQSYPGHRLPRALRQP